MAVWGGFTNSCEKKRMKSKGEKEREKTLESPLNCKDIQPVHPKGNQS